MPQTQFARVIAAQAKGYCAAENLNLIFVPSGPDVDNVAVGGGSGHYLPAFGGLEAMDIAWRFMHALVGVPYRIIEKGI